MAISWHTDAATPAGPSSMDLVLRWLLKPGNYKRWTASPDKTTFMKEIVKEMEKNGIKHRKPRDVYAQIYSLMRRFEPVKMWLEDQGQLELFCRGESTNQVEAQMQRRYPHFRELMPLFGHDGDGTASDEEGEDGDEGTDQGSSDEDEYHPINIAGSKRKSVSSPQDTSELPMSKRGRRETSKTQTRPKIAQQTEARGARAHLGASPVDRLPWESEDGDDDYDVTNATQTGNAGPGRDVELKLAAIRLQEVRKREKLRTEAEGMRTEAEEMRTKAEKLLLRHKMKREGISDEEINSAIPM